MYRHSDPRFRRTLNQLSQNLETANETAQAGLFSVSHNYIAPCVETIGACLRTCQDDCFPNREDRLRRHRGRRYGREESSFDFYDDWEADENDALLTWDNDGLESLLSRTDAYGSVSTQPGQQSSMRYGARRERESRLAIPKRRGPNHPRANSPDPTLIPKTSYLGFLGRLPFKIGAKGLRYKPSAADLQDHPGLTRRDEAEVEPLLEESDEENASKAEDIRTRNRSATVNSGHTTDSLSSRGDLFPSEDEDDAIPLDDEFANVLERRGTNMTSTDEASSGKTGRSRKVRPISTRTVSSGSALSSPAQHDSSGPTTPRSQNNDRSLNLPSTGASEERSDRDQVALPKKEGEASNDDVRMVSYVLPGNTPSSSTEQAQDAGPAQSDTSTGQGAGPHDSPPFQQMSPSGVIAGDEPTDGGQEPQKFNGASLPRFQWSPD